MTQTQLNKSTPSVGTAAAQAAAGATTKPADAKPAETKPTDAKPADNKPAEGAASAEGAAPAGKKRESKKRVFVVVGEIHEFESVNQAEKFLNSPEAPTGEYAVLQGIRSRTSKRVSLR